MLNWRDITHPNAGGAERYIHEIGKRMVPRHEVTLFCGRYPGCRSEETIDGIRIIRIGGTFSVYIRSALKVIGQRNSFDVVVDDINGVPFFSPLYSKAPVVAVVHHIVGWPIFKRELPFPMSIVGYLGEKSIPTFYRNCDFVTVSASTRKELEEFGIQSGLITVIQNGIDLPAKIAPVKTPDPTVLYLGRIKEYKRLDQVIRAFAEVRKTFPKAQLVIAGRGETAPLRSLSIEMGLSDYVRFPGEVSEEEKEDLLSSAWVFVSASMKEGWGISIIEANASGTPAVSYDVPGLRDSIKDGYNGILVSEGNLEKLVQALISIIGKKEFREELSNNALTWAGNFSWDKSAEEFEELLIRVTSKKNLS